MAQTPRERARLQTMDEIVLIGRRHLAENGAGGLSLRAVARDLGVVSSAVYRYVKSRDELLTLLVVDGYNALGDAVDLAVDAARPDDYAGQFTALGRAVRDWALAEPSRYGLLFGSPVPGYDAPAEQTTGPGTRVIVQLVRILQEAHLAGGLKPAGLDVAGLKDASLDSPGGARAAPAGRGTAQAQSRLSKDFATIRNELGLTLDDAALACGVLVWSALFGAVSFEVFGQYGRSTFADPEALFETQLGVLASVAGLIPAAA